MTSRGNKDSVTQDQVVYGADGNTKVKQDTQEVPQLFFKGNRGRIDVFRGIFFTGCLVFFLRVQLSGFPFVCEVFSHFEDFFIKSC